MSNGKPKSYESAEEGGINSACWYHRRLAMTLNTGCILTLLRELFKNTAAWAPTLGS